MLSLMLRVLRIEPIILLFACLVTAVGCEGWRNSVAARGGVVGSYAGNYVVINYAGNTICDVWVLRGVYCQSEQNSDGWMFRDEQGNVVRLGGDVKVMRLERPEDLAKWHEYHAEFETKTYQQKFCVAEHHN